MGLIDVEIGFLWEQVRGVICPKLNFMMYCSRLALGKAVTSIPWCTTLGSHCPDLGLLCIFNAVS